MYCSFSLNYQPERIGNHKHVWWISKEGEGIVSFSSDWISGLTRLSMLRSMASSRKAASVQTLWMEPTTVALEAGMPKMNVQMESRSNWEEKHKTWVIHKPHISTCMRIHLSWGTRMWSLRWRDKTTLSCLSVMFKQFWVKCATLHLLNHSAQRRSKQRRHVSVIRRRKRSGVLTCTCRLSGSSVTGCCRNRAMSRKYSSGTLVCLGNSVCITGNPGKWQASRLISRSVERPPALRPTLKPEEREEGG